jgi:predicted aspartyl protease
MNSWPLISRRLPCIPLRVHTRREDVDLDALLDTGFDGALLLPPTVLSSIPRQFGTFSGRLADGAEVLAPAYWADVSIGPVRIERVAVVSLGDKPMIGRRLISRFRVTLDHGARAIVEP